MLLEKNIYLLLPLAVMHCKMNRINAVCKLWPFTDPEELVGSVNNSISITIPYLEFPATRAYEFCTKVRS